MTRKHRVPLWLMGLTNLTYGMYGGIIAYAIIQLMGARNIPESSIASLTAIAFTPGWWAFLFSPVLDVRFSRRWYAVVLALIASVTLIIAFLNLEHLGILKITLTLGFFCAFLYQSAVGGWLSSITSKEEEETLSVWITVANVGGFGLMAISCNQLVTRFSTTTVAFIIGAIVLLPTLVFPFMQAPGPDRRLAKESFSQFFGELVQLVKRREVLIAVALFLLPAGTFSLTNVLGARGGDFKASANFVATIGGAGVAIGGVVGCFLFPLVKKSFSLRWLYLAIGFFGSLVTLSLMLLPHQPWAFAVALIGENLLQSLAITVSMAIIFETIGQNNPLAATTFCFVSSMYGVPISLMPYLDSFGFTKGGIAGSFFADGVAGLVASVLLGGMLWWVGRRAPRVAVAG